MNSRGDPEGTSSPPPRGGGGVQHYKLEPPPIRGGRSSLELMMLYQNMKIFLKISLSVMLKNSKFEILKYYGPNKIEF